MSRGDGRKDSADQLLPPQAAGMSCYSVAEEITPVCADYLVELRGFELLTSCLLSSALVRTRHFTKPPPWRAAPLPLRELEAP